MRLAYAVAIAMVAEGCGGSGAELLVDLKTDLVPGFEVDAIVVTLSREGGRVDGQTSSAVADQDFGAGVRVATFEGLPGREHGVRVQLMLAGEPVIARDALLVVSGRTAVTLVMTRDCRGVTCDDPGASACLAGRCVDPRCVEESPGACGAPECAAASGCSEGAACTRAACVVGACLYPPASGACGPGDRCDPDVGCVPADEGPLDAGMGDPDAGSGGCRSEVYAGGDVSCAIDAASVLSCWGSNDRGKLGIASMDTSMWPSPQTVGALSDVQRVVVGADHVCAIAAAQTLWCWGGDTFGQVGSPGAAEDRDEPFETMAGVAAVAAGAFHTCSALAGEDGLLCWGRNTTLQLGIADGADRDAPTATQLDAGVFTMLSAGRFHTCGVVGAEVLCWGAGAEGQLGDATLGPMRATTSPVQGLPASRVVALASGDQHTCALDELGAVHCWGSNLEGQLGNPEAIDLSSTALAVATAESFVGLAAGTDHTCALTAEGEAYCWGDNDFGSTGHAGGLDQTTPAVVTAVPPLVALAAGLHHTLGLAEDGSIWGWGRNAFGELGDGTTEMRPPTLTVACD